MAQTVARLRGQQQEQRLRRRDEDIGGRALEGGAIRGWRIAGANGHRRQVAGRAHGFGDVGDAGQRCPQVALDVHGQGLERRDVEHPAPRLARRHRREHQPVEAPQKRRERLARARRRQNQRRLPPGDRRPAQLLRSGGTFERAGEPPRDRRLEEREYVEAHHRYNASDVRAGSAPPVRPAREHREDRPDTWVMLLKG
jgi:hypothetical protein